MKESFDCPTYSYGMPLRGYGLACQPMRDLIGVKDVSKVRTGFWSIVTYSRPLTTAEISEYELVPIPCNQENLS